MGSVCFVLFDAPLDQRPIVTITKPLGYAFVKFSVCARPIKASFPLERFPVNVELNVYFKPAVYIIARI